VAWEAPPKEGPGAKEAAARIWRNCRGQQRWRRHQPRVPLPAGAEALQAAGSGLLGREGGGRQLGRRPGRQLLHGAKVRGKTRGTPGTEGTAAAIEPVLWMPRRRMDWWTMTEDGLRVDG
jgi:hypothetical protein